jgi:hypothetical protein
LSPCFPALSFDFSVAVSFGRELPGEASSLFLFLSDINPYCIQSGERLVLLLQGGFPDKKNWVHGDS